MSKSEILTEQEFRRAWLSDHLPYELCMMRYALARMRNSPTQLEYNAFFECFCVKARNLIEFLTCRNRKNTNIDSKYFAPSFKAPDRQGVQTTLNNIDGHVVHNSKQRPIELRYKIHRAHCEALALWVEGAMKLFLESLPSGDRAMWREDRATCSDTIVISLSRFQSSAADPWTSGTGPTGQES